MPDMSLQLRDVEKSFGDNYVIRRLSLEVMSGEVFTLLGASGCGKSTTLRIIAGLEAADAGIVEFQGVQWVNTAKRVEVAPQRRGIGMVFQSYAIWPHMTVFQHVAYPMRNRKMDKRDVRRRVEEILHIVGLGGLEDRPAVQLSGGQQQRVAVARAIVHEPGLLLLDEPFSNLDVNLREQLRIELKQLQQRLGLTIILVTHDQLDAFALSDRIGVMRNGQIEQIDNGRIVYERPSNQFVREFVGRSVMIYGAVKNRDDAATTVAFDDGSRLGVAAVNCAPGLSVGDKVSVWIRPEDLHVASDGAITAVHGALWGTVESAVFLGDRYGCVVVLDCTQKIWTYIPRAFHPKREQRISLAVDPRDAHMEPYAASGAGKAPGAASSPVEGMVF